MRVYISIPSWKNQEALNELKQKADVVIAETRPNQSEFEQIVREFDGVIIGRLHSINNRVLQKSKLRFVGLLARGTSNVDIDACKRHNVAVFYTPEANTASVAEHVLALILGLSKNIVQLNSKVRKGLFDEFRYSTIEIKDKLLGIVGAGPIAAEVIRRARSFDMKIQVYTPHPEKHHNLEVDFVSLNSLLSSSDFVSINIPLTQATENFIDTKELALMKPTSFLVNTSRGKVVNEKALVTALAEHQIAGAGIDVFEEEPTNNKELFALENVILTPHIAGVSKEALKRMEEHVCLDIVAFLNDKKAKYRLA